MGSHDELGYAVSRLSEGVACRKPVVCDRLLLVMCLQGKV